MSGVGRDLERKTDYLVWQKEHLEYGVYQRSDAITDDGLQPPNLSEQKILCASAALGSLLQQTLLG